jgi:hypothetical protein
VQDSIERVAFCVVIGCALAPIVAAALSRSGQPRTFGILPRLLLAGCPTYFGVDYLVYQGFMTVAYAAASFAFVLYCLRGWWLPERLPRAVIAFSQSKTQAMTGDFRVSRQRQRTNTLTLIKWWLGKILVGLFGLFLLAVVLQHGWQGVSAVIMGVFILAFVAVVIHVVRRLFRWAMTGSPDTLGDHPGALPVTLRMLDSNYKPLSVNPEQRSRTAA